MNQRLGRLFLYATDISSIVTPENDDSSIISFSSHEAEEMNEERDVPSKFGSIAALLKNLQENHSIEKKTSDRNQITKTNWINKTIHFMSRWASRPRHLRVA